jgi:hypothetical protein
MNLKIATLAAAAAVTLAVPAAALAQPYYGGGWNGYDRRYDDRGDWRRIEREREWRRQEDMRRWRWEHRYSGYGYDSGYRPYYR